MTSTYGSLRFSLILAAIYLNDLVAVGPALPVQAKLALNVLCSTSITRSYFAFMILEACGKLSGQDFASGFKI